MKNRKTIIIVASVVGFIGLVTILFFVLKSKNKLPEFLNKEKNTNNNESTNTQINTLSKCTLTEVQKTEAKKVFASMTKEQVIAYQQELNRYLTVARANKYENVPEDLVIDGDAGNCTYAVHIYVTELMKNFKNAPTN